MTRALGSLAAAVLAVGILASTAGAVQANGAFANHPDIRMFTPTPLVHDAAMPAVATVQPPDVVVHVVFDALALDRAYRRALAWEYRKDRIHRVFGHRYTGFIKMYRGPRYPL